MELDAEAMKLARHMSKLDKANRMANESSTENSEPSSNEEQQQDLSAKAESMTPGKRKSNARKSDAIARGCFSTEGCFIPEGAAAAGVQMASHALPAAREDGGYPDYEDSSDEGGTERRKPQRVRYSRWILLACSVLTTLAIMFLLMGGKLSSSAAPVVPLPMHPSSAGLQHGSTLGAALQAHGAGAANSSKVITKFKAAKGFKMGGARPKTLGACRSGLDPAGLRVSRLYLGYISATSKLACLRVPLAPTAHQPPCRP